MLSPIYDSAKMTENEIKYKKMSTPIFWTKNKKRAQKSIFQWRLDEEKECYFLSRLGIYNGFLGLIGKVMYYLPEEDQFKVVRKCF